MAARIKWEELSTDILRRLNLEKRSISYLSRRLGCSRATAHRLASGRKVEAALYLATCEWLGYSPYLYVAKDM